MRGVGRDRRCERSVHQPRGDHVESEAARRVGRGGRSSEGLDAGLRGRDRLVVRQTEGRRGARDEHDRGRRSLEVAAGGTHDRERGGEVGVQDVAPLFERRAMSRREQDRADQVGHALQSSVLFEDATDHGVDGLRVSSIDVDSLHAEIAARCRRIPAGRDDPGAELVRRRHTSRPTPPAAPRIR